MKFVYLLKKELKELLTPTTILTLVVSVVALIALGGVMGNVMEETTESADKITLCNKDEGDYSKAVIKALVTAGYEVNEIDISSDDYVEEMNSKDISDVVIIPETFSSQIGDVLAGKTVEKDGEKVIAPVDVEYVTRMNSLSITGNADVGSTVALSAIEGAVKSVVYANKNMSVEEIKLIESPVNLIETTIVNNKQAKVSSTLLSAYVMMTSMFVPIVVYILIIYSSQMIINAVATEKIDKTLETLLSAPVSRLSVLSAKMIAATIISAVYAVGFMVGYSYMMDGMTGSIAGAIDSGIISELGLNMSVGGYVLLGAQMFLSLLITLAISLILGALAKDAKSSQSLLMPIMFMAMVPYMISMFVDFKSLGALKWIMYAIPYTHTFMAQSNIILGDMATYFGGLIYQIVLLVIFMTLAVRLFMSDKIFTISLDFGQKKNKFTAKKNKKS